MEKDCQKLLHRCERLERTAVLLRTIREVVRIGSTGKSLDRIAKGVCETVVANRGYVNAWMALHSEKFPDVYAEERIGPDFRLLEEKFRSAYYPECVSRAVQPDR